MNNHKIKNVIVTGATGMLGRALIDYCLSRGIKILALVRPASGKWRSLPYSPLLGGYPCHLAELKDLTFYQLRQGNSIMESAEMAIPSAYDIFFHLGWDNTFGSGRDDTATQTANISYTLEAVKLAARLNCKTFIGAGSQAEYGRVAGTISPATPAFPENGYGIAKLCAGQMSSLLCAQLGIRHIWARIFSIYGPYDNPGTMVMSSIADYLSGLSPSHTKGEQLWDYLYASDCARALYLLAASGEAGGTYCIGSGQALPLKDYIRTIRDETNPAAPLRLGVRPYADKQVMHLEADISKLTADTGFQPQVPFDEGIKKTIQWWKKENKNEDQDH